MTDANGFQHMARFLERPDRPTAVLCAVPFWRSELFGPYVRQGWMLAVTFSVIAHDDDLLLLKPSISARR